MTITVLGLGTWTVLEEDLAEGEVVGAGAAAEAGGAEAAGKGEAAAAGAAEALVAAGLLANGFNQAFWAILGPSLRPRWDWSPQHPLRGPPPQFLQRHRRPWYQKGPPGSGQSSWRILGRTSRRAPDWSHHRRWRGARSRLRDSDCNATLITATKWKNDRFCLGMRSMPCLCD